MYFFHQNKSFSWIGFFLKRGEIISESSSLKILQHIFAIDIDLNKTKQKISVQKCGETPPSNFYITYEKILLLTICIGAGMPWSVAQPYNISLPLMLMTQLTIFMKVYNEIFHEINFFTTCLIISTSMWV